MISIELWRSRIGLFNNKCCSRGFLSSSFSSSSYSYRPRKRTRREHSSAVNACSPLQPEKCSTATVLDDSMSASNYSSTVNTTTTTTSTTSSSTSSSSSSSSRGVVSLHYHTSLLGDILIILLIIISQQLIILSGDIEANPGPRNVDQKPDFEDLLCMSYTGKDGKIINFRLMDQVKPHWRRLAIALMFPQHEIAAIANENDPVYYIFSEWLRGANQEKDSSRPVTWRTLINALRVANVHNEANVLEQHCVNSMATQSGCIIKQGSIEVEVAPAVPEGLHPLMVQYADMLVVVRTTKLSDENFYRLKLFLTEYCDVDAIEDCSSLSQVVKLLKERFILYIFNVDTLIVCCKHFDTFIVKESILKYKDMLDTFFSNTSVKAFKCSLLSQWTDLHGLESVILKLDDARSENTLKALKKLVHHFFGNFGKALIPCNFRPGCVCITWLVPTSLVPSLRIKAEQLSREYLASQGVLELVIGLRLVPNEESASSSISDADSAEVKAERQIEKPETVDYVKPDKIATGADDEDIQAKISTYKQMSRARDQEILDLKKQMSVMEEFGSELKVVSEQKLEKCEAELKVLRKKNSDYEEKCEQQETELKVLRKEKSDYEEKCEQQETELKAVRKEKSDFEEKCEKQETELKVVHKENSDCKEKCKRQETELKAVRKEKSDYEEKCEQLETELKAVRKENSDYKEKCKQQEEKLKAIQKMSAHDDEPHWKTGTFEQTRKLKKQGYLLMKKAAFSSGEMLQDKDWTSVFAVLDVDKLLFYPDDKTAFAEQSGSRPALGSFYLLQTHMVDPKDTEANNIIQLRSFTGEQLHLGVDELRIMNDWSSDIQAAIDHTNQDFFKDPDKHGEKLMEASLPGSQQHIHIPRASDTESRVNPDSELSDSIRTLVPISRPGKPFATKVTHDSITLEWKRPKQGAQYLKHYQVVYYSTDDSDNVASCTAEEEKVTLLKLDPESAYIFKVKAETVTGSISESEISKPIKTLLSPPGKPYATDITYKGFHVNWQKPSYGSILYYSISYQATNDPQDVWHTTTTVGDMTHFPFSASPGNFYVFKVAAVTSAGVSSDSELSDPIETLAEPWCVKIYRSLKPIPNSNPPTCLLPTHCVMQKNYIVKVHVGANSQGKTRRGVHTSCSCHTRTAGVPHKVLMLVGATGVGKTTLINGMANYIMGVQWDDDFRFKLIAESASRDQSKSQTMCITAYTFYKESGSNLPYTLTVIDTPGFGDTAGLMRDVYIVSQIKELFSIAGDEGIDVLHGIGFVTQAPWARLTPTQRYVFDAILSVFGKDVADNIFLMITFADGMKPPVLDAVKAAGVPNKAFFKFNNSALFAIKSADDEFDRMFWKMGTKSFDEFFKQFSNAQAQSLQLSSEVIQERETLEVTIQGLQPQIQLGLSKIDELRQERQMLKDHEADILANQDFSYRVEVTKQRKIDLPRGTYTTNCLICNYTCHDNCPYPDDDDKYKCSAMCSGRSTRNAECGVCPKKCSWKVHKNNPYRFEIYQDYETRTSDELKTRYESAMSSKEQLECVIKKMKKELDTMNTAVLRKMEQARRSVQRLQEIALKPNYLTEVEYIDLIIETEKREHKPRWMDRVKALEGVRQQAEIVTQLMKNPQAQQQNVFSIEETAQEKSMWQKFLHTIGVK